MFLMNGDLGVDLWRSDPGVAGEKANAKDATGR